MGLITHKHPTNQSAGVSAIPFAVAKTSAQSTAVMLKEKKDRQRYSKDFCSALAKPYCQSQGYGYLTWERRGAPGAQGEVRYFAIGSDWQKPINLPFTDDMQQKMFAIEKWVQTGEGLAPEFPGEAANQNTQPLPSIVKVASARQMSR